MAPMNVQVKRNEWRAGFDPARPLEEQLGAPFTPAWQIAHVMGVSESTVYDSGKRFDAAMRAGDPASAAREVPCVLMGHSHRFPTDAFLTWWRSAGGLTLERLTGPQSAA
jgi:hypothetical protein